MYDGCPRSASMGVWWPRTNFGSEAVENCPRGALGKASRSCDNQLGGWQQPDLFNCTSDRFAELRTQVSLNYFVCVCTNLVKIFMQTYVTTVVYITVGVD